MTIREEAERIIFEARNLREADAVELIEARLKRLFIEGERSGIEEIRQKIVAKVEAE